MKRLASIVIFGIIVAWIVVVVIDFCRVKFEIPPMFCIKESTHKYADGEVYECLGLGYKVYEYNRKSIKEINIGFFFMKEKNSSK